MSQSHHIFYDPRGRRRKVVKVAVGLILAILLFLAWYAKQLFHRLPVLPVIAQLQDTAHELETEKHKTISKVLLKSIRADLEREIQETNNFAKRLKNSAYPTKVWSLYEPDNESAYYSFKAHAEQVTDLVLTTINLTSDGQSTEPPKINWVAGSQMHETIALTKEKGVRLYARLTNDSADGYLPDPVMRLINSPDIHAALIQRVIAEMQTGECSGLIVDFRGLEKPHYFKLLPFFVALRKAWDAEGMTGMLGITYQATNVDMPLWKFGEIFDVVLMRAFGERSPTQAPGPVASATWFQNAFQFALSNIPPEKLVILFDNAAYDWNAADNRARHRTYLSVLLKAKEIVENTSWSTTNPIVFDEGTFNSNFGYLDDEGNKHHAWFGDAINSFNQYSQVFHAGLKQTGVWALGAEDPGVWSFLGKDPTLDSTRVGLKEILFPYEVQFEGRGDILIPQSDVTVGERSIEYDPVTKLITRSQYLKYPSAVVVQHLGYKPKTIALTFDDGPIEPYTGEILDILKREQVKATFFVIGSNIEANPELLRRVYAEGHDIGNHTFAHPELTLVSKQRELLELNGTQRLVQSILGRSLVLFRPPYISEGSPASIDEVRVIRVAADIGYITVGISADAQDWELYKKDEDGNEVRRTAADLTAEILDDLEGMQGNAILFHDGPRDREATVAAVGLLIPELKRRGYAFASISELLGVPRAELLPAVSKDELLLGGLSRAYIETIYFGRTVLEIIFILVAVFGVLRLLSFVILSTLSFRSEKKYDATTETFKPPVSVVVAAYNEEKVIFRTIKSLLASRYPELEIIVVDDGSSDNTSAIVAKEFAHEPRVTLITKENGGKSSALNVGLAASKYDIMIGLDADTQYSRDAIGAMARHFADEKVGAVAGNVKIGNRNNWLLQCQSIEYITNQNFGRRAFAVADAITVVPGAAGAWRKKAVEEVGLYLADTLGEDMELTWRVRKAGYKIVFEPRATAYTEAPHNFSGVFKQRFRWMYGQFQILWKHRDVFFNADHKWFGWFGAPLVLMDDLFLFLSPLADLQALISLTTFIIYVQSSPGLSLEALSEAGPLALFIKTMVVYIIFFGTEILCTVVAFKMDKEPLRPIWLLFLKQFFYRQLTYIVAYKAMWRALTGWRQKWGVLHRTGTVEERHG
jgi:cellulose synthase/poly-beta-1,6-N-acetylglucosamine synthase-like glycosyltransferase/peptidoglycan/xylan/chitin deacetylase (PgdA/CDA1 family)/spore germination protein YaaH